MFSKAIVRAPSENFADGLTSVDLGVPVFETALVQHRAYCEALVRCGLSLIELEPDPKYPDSTFVEDTAILTEKCAVITRPGAPSRSGEILSMAATLSKYYDKLDAVQPPGTIDGGDVCQIENHFLIGISDRTNEEGARQLSKYLQAAGFTSSHVDIRGINGLLHLKSGISYLGENRVLVTDALAGEKELEGFELVGVARRRRVRSELHSGKRLFVIRCGLSKAAKNARRFGVQDHRSGDVRISKNGWRIKLPVTAILSEQRDRERRSQDKEKGPAEVGKAFIVVRYALTDVRLQLSSHFP